MELRDIVRYTGVSCLLNRLYDERKKREEGNKKKKEKKTHTGDETETKEK